MTLSLHSSAPKDLRSPLESLPPSRFLFLSSCPEPWGGSEELWSSAARKLAGGGHQVAACKTVALREHPRISELARAGVVVGDYLRPDLAQFARALGHLCFSFVRNRLHPRKESGPGIPQQQEPPRTFAQSLKAKYVAVLNAALKIRIRSIKPDLVVISQGENFDGVDFAKACREIGVPYVLISQKASDLNWPVDSVLDRVHDAYYNARASYFVSEHNRALTERQLAITIPNAEVVRNPFLTQVDGALPYPETSDGQLRLACIARLFALEKGQDTLLQILSQEKWRRRNIDVDFYGQGVHRNVLERAAKTLDLQNVSFKGFTNDITTIWKTHHALILPSRCEGLPLVIVEAMLCGRTVIVTNAGGNGELVDDDETGFVARGTDAASLDDAMERAWNRRAQWERMGQEAAERVRISVPVDPGGDFAMKLVGIVHPPRA
jgi:glycosyltransferase involved in cell wall biosynthesis